MGYPTKVQLIRRKSSEQWYINFPSAVAQAMDFERGETVEWFVKDRATLVLKRPSAPPLEVGKAKKGGSSTASRGSSQRAEGPSRASAATRGRRP